MTALEHASDSFDDALGRTRLPAAWRSLSVGVLTVRAYLVVRLLAAIGLAAIFLLDTGFQYPFRSAEAYGAGILLFAVVGSFQLLASMRSRTGIRVALWVALPFDVLALSLLVFGTHNSEDPIYPLVIGMALFYSSNIRGRQSWMLSALAAIAYVVAHAVAGPVSPPLYLALVFKGASIVLLGSAASWVIERQSRREALLRESRERIQRLNAELRRRLAELNAVSEITDIVHSSLDFDNVGPLVIEVLLRAIRLPTCTIAVIDRKRGETLFSASRDDSGEGAERPSSASASSTAAGDGAVPIPCADIHFECATLVDHNSMQVVFCAEPGRFEAMSEDDRMVLHAVAGELAVAVENSRLYKLTKHLAVTDDLTGLHNYRYLQDRLDEEVERARRYGNHLSLLMVDADDFKGLNDVHGHLVGDRVLVELGQVMRSVLREVDLLARYGGEEFSVVLPETDAAGAFVVAEKLREAVAAHGFADEHGNATIRMSVSIGLATFPIHASDKESLLRESDDALYEAKHTGRDRVRAPKPGRPPRTIIETEEAS